jgi:endonuclease YncB( thermonuclease family)
LFKQKKILIYLLGFIPAILLWPVSIPGAAAYATYKSKMPAKVKTQLSLVLLLSIYLFSSWWFPLLLGQTPQALPPIPVTPVEATEVVRVEASLLKVVDGDTLTVMLNGVETKLRLIGIDTPELASATQSEQCYASQAKQRLQQITQGKKLLLEKDPTQGEVDKYGRSLVYLFLPDSVNINLQLINEGYAREYTYNKPYKYKQDFLAAELRAKNLQIGVWGSDCLLAR